MTRFVYCEWIATGSRSFLRLQSVWAQSAAGSCYIGTGTTKRPQLPLQSNSK